MDVAVIEQDDCSDSISEITGNVIVKGQHVLIRINSGFEELLTKYQNESIDICFRPNRNVFQLQHNALSWMRKHKLANIIYTNELYLDQPLPTSSKNELR